MKAAYCVSLIAALAMMVAGCNLEKFEDLRKEEGHVTQNSFAAASATFQERSLMIRDRQVLDQASIKELADFGYLLGELNNWVRTLSGQQSPNRRAGAFIARAFEQAINEQKDHAAAPVQSRLGAVPIGGRFARNMSAVFRNWLPVDELKEISKLDDLRDGPFRLIAIANRMDLAGDVDDRGNSVAAEDPRALGEIHLIYNLIDSKFEQEKGKPFPLTFSVAYRLPSWDGHSQWEMIDNEAVWQEQITKWAASWDDLKKHTKTSVDYREKLRLILRTALTPQNYVGMNSNTKITNSEFELRSWYMIQTTQSLIKRKPRREPYPCLSGSSELEDLVNHYWEPSYRDLDVSTRRDVDTFVDGLNGFTVLRTSQQYSRVVKDVDKPWSTCLDGANNRPFLIDEIGGNNTDPDVRLMLAPFGRVTQNGPIWQTGTFERRRHAFAIRTCSGCHGPEGATFGFHVSPKLPHPRRQGYRIT